jgi:hypothetical protein
MLEKFKESIFSVLPVFVIVVILTLLGIFTNTFSLSSRENIWTIVLFLLGSIMLIVGLSLFSLGADLSLLKVGEQVGNYLTNKRKVWLLLFIGFLIGLIITVAEPDLLVLAESFSIPSIILILAVAFGVGIFLAFALLRIVLQISLVKILVIAYIFTFILAFIVNSVNPSFLPVAFDSGGVTTGPMTVPFILALGMGVAHARGGRKSNDDSFGLVALCSLGPIIFVLILGLFANAGEQTLEHSHVTNFIEMINEVCRVFAYKLRDIAIAISGVFAFILVFEFAIIPIT